MASTPNKRSAGIVNMASGGFSGAGAIETVTLGFTPRFVTVFNVTDVITWEKHVDMAATICKKFVSSGTQTADTSTAITIATGNFSLSAALAANAKVITWIAWG